MDQGKLRVFFVNGNIALTILLIIMVDVPTALAPTQFSCFNDYGVAVYLHSEELLFERLFHCMLMYHHSTVMLESCLLILIRQQMSFLYFVGFNSKFSFVILGSHFLFTPVSSWFVLINSHELHCTRCVIILQFAQGQTVGFLPLPCMAKLLLQFDCFRNQLLGHKPFPGWKILIS